MLRNRLNDYDIEGWQRFYAENPGYRRSVGADGAAGEGEGGEGGSGDGGSGDNGSGDDGQGGDGGADNWRDAFVEGIEDADQLKKERTRLERFGKPADMWKSFREAESKITAGELLKPLPKDATDEDVAKYREQMGIPEKAEGYLENLPEGLVLGDDDKVVFEDFAGALHEVNAPPEVAHQAIKWYNEFTEKADAMRQEADEQLADETEEMFREEWGKEYRKNVNLVNAFVDSTFGEAGEAFKNSRTGEGIPMLSDPAILRGLAQMARELNPAAALVLGDVDPNKGLDDAIGEIENVMKNERSRYNKDEAMQARYRTLLAARQKRDEKGQAA